MHRDLEFIQRTDGSTAVVITLPGEHLGVDAAVMADWFDTVFWAMDKLRSGAWNVPGRDTVNEIGTAITHLEHRLSPRLGGLRDALIRAHYAAGGSHAELGHALDTARSTAQGIAKRLPTEPTVWEKWARRELPGDTAAPARQDG